MTLVAGSQLGPYRIVSQLGAGGMGVVYQATDPRLKRTVAIKLLPPDLTRDEIAKQRFLQEAQAASALDHQSFCKSARRLTSPTSAHAAKSLVGAFGVISAHIV